MEDLENKISEILGDPQAMEGILSLAQSLGLTPPEQTAEAPASPPAAASADPMAGSMAQLLAMAGSLGGRELALLQALRPLLREDRQAKLDRAIQAARISQIAGTAMKTLGNKDHGR